MRKLLNSPLIVAALCGLAVALLAASLWDSGHPSPYRSLADDISLPLAQSASASSIDSEAIAALAQSDLPRNPFARYEQAVALAAATVEEGMQRTIRVMAIWVQESVRYASLDGHIVKEGQPYLNTVVERIDSQGVWLVLGGERRLVRPGESWSYQYIE